MYTSTIDSLYVFLTPNPNSRNKLGKKLKPFRKLRSVSIMWVNPSTSLRLDFEKRHTSFPQCPLVPVTLPDTVIYEWTVRRSLVCDGCRLLRQGEDLGVFAVRRLDEHHPNGSKFVFLFLGRIPTKDLYNCLDLKFFVWSKHIQR